jgi:hypothetical protein
MFWPLYSRYPLNRRLAGPHSPSRPFIEAEKLFCLSRIETKFLVRLARSLVAILTEIFGLPLYNRNADKDSTKRRWYVGADVRAQLLYCNRNYFAKMCELNCFGVNYLEEFCELNKECLGFLEIGSNCTPSNTTTLTIWISLTLNLANLIKHKNVISYKYKIHVSVYWNWDLIPIILFTIFMSFS